MTVRAVDVYYRDKSAFPNVLLGTVLGIEAGRVIRSTLPVTPKENDFSMKAIRMSCNKTANKDMVDLIKKSAKENNKKLTLAQDAFVKMIENKKGNEGFLANSIAKKVEELEAKVPGAGQEYQEIIAKVNTSARKRAETIIKGCKRMVKSERSVAGFVIPGAIAGFLAGVLVNAFRDSKQA